RLMSSSPKGLPIYTDGPAASSSPLDEEHGPDAEGWVRRYLADPKRADEARAMYENIGFEVEFRTPDPRDVREMSEDCGECREQVCISYVVVHTRRRLK
ncbi:MAG: hypothetical protein JRH11_22835, partial [Deltaproteobacteria bacterium]|nr:hypothetical protein [Deltaproteobacteria bacterium]